MAAFDAIVVGGGLVGSAIAYGLQRQGLATLMLDEGDTAFRAARGNFGLVWVQSKGANFPPYAQWTWKSAEAWSALRDEIQNISCINLDYSRPGGVEVCLEAEDMNAKQIEMQKLVSHANHIKYDMMDRKSLANLLPGLGKNVAGGCYSNADGHVNPLKLLQGLHIGLRAKGGIIDSGAPVISIDAQKSKFSVATKSGSYSAARLVIAAGLGTKKLANLIGLKIPVRPIRGQNLILERVHPFLAMPMATIRQTTEGSVQIGASEEDVGFDEGVSTDVLNNLASRAVRIFPHLAQARVIRSWGALRTMTPDGYPVYTQSEKYPGAFAAVCHSGVTLAAAHVFLIARAIANGRLPPEVAAMGEARFSRA